MGSLQKTRMFVFSLFFVALIIFAGLYRPLDAISRPAGLHSAATATK